VAAANHQLDEFYRGELQTRKQFGYPPFARLAMLRFAHRHRERVETFARELSDWLRREISSRSLSIRVLGPSEAPLARLKGEYRWQCLLRSASVKELKELLSALEVWVAQRKSPVALAADIDPIQSL